MKNSVLGFCGLALTGLVSFPVSASDYGVLVEDTGVEEVYGYCSACHSERIVAQQGLSRESWIELLDWMVEEQGMGEIEEPDFSLVIDYLSKNYNTDRPNFPK